MGPHDVSTIADLLCKLLGMNDSTPLDPQQPPSLETRVQRLEEMQAHEQRLLEQLNEVVRDLNREIAAISQITDQHRSRLEWLSKNLPAEPRSLEDEKPPHY